MKTRVRKSALLKRTAILLTVTGMLGAGLFAFRVFCAQAEEQLGEAYALRFALSSDGSVERSLEKYTLGTDSNVCEQTDFSAHFGEYGICSTQMVGSASATEVTVSDGVLSFSDTISSDYSRNGVAFHDSDDLDFQLGIDYDDPQIEFSLVNYEGLALNIYVPLSVAEEPVVRYTVSYRVINGNYPYFTNVSTFPADAQFEAGAQVSVAQTPTAQASGETLNFVGWTSDDVEIENGQFEMPESNVELIGYFEGSDNVTITKYYSSDIPESCKDATPISVARYTAIDRHVSANGDTCRSHTFNGWQPATDEDTYDDDYIYADLQTEIVATFTAKPSYTVQYSAVASTDDPDSYTMPAASDLYYEGESLALADLPTANNYIFDGWYSDVDLEAKIANNTITVPAITSDTVETVYGHWTRDEGAVEPTISVEKLTQEDSFLWTDEVEFEIEVTNPEDFDIKDVVVKPSIKYQVSGSDEIKEYGLSELTQNLSFDNLPEGVTYNSESGELTIAEIAAGDTIDSIVATFYINRDLTQRYDFSASITEAQGEETNHLFYALENPVESTVVSFYENSSEDSPDTFITLSSTSNSNQSQPQSLLPKIILTLVSAAIIIPCAIIASRKRVRLCFRFAALGVIAVLLTFAIATMAIQPESIYASQQTTQVK